MTEQPDKDQRSNKPSLALRAILGVVASIFAGLFAHQAMGDPITTVIAALFFGAGVFFTIGQTGHGAGVDGGGGDGGGDGGGG